MVETEIQECMSRFLRGPAAGMQRMERRFLALEEKQKPSPCGNRWSSDFPARLYPGSLSTGSVAEASRQGT